MEDYFSPKANETLTRDVIIYNGMRDGDKKDEIERKLISKMEMLIFLIPLRNGYLTREDITEFYLQQRVKAREIIRCYVISKVSFMHYLTQVLRKRARIFILQKYKEKRNEILLESVEYDSTVYDGFSFCDALERYEADERESGFTFSGLYDNLDLKEIALLMMESDEATPSPLPKRREEALRCFLERPRERKDFIFFLLNSPSDGLRHRSLDISKVLSLREEIIIRFFELKDEYKAVRNGDKREKIRVVACKHFIRILKKDMDLRYATHSEEERKEILGEEAEILRNYKKKIMQLRNLNRGLNQSEISKLLNYTRSRVSQGVKHTREALMMIESLSDE